MTNSVPPLWSRWQSVTFIVLSVGGIPEWPGQWACRVLMMLFIVGTVAGRIAHGIRLRRPYWTAASWLRYLAALIVPVGLIGLMFAVTFAADVRLSIVGHSRSPLRFAWVAAAVVSGIVGTFWLMAVIDRMLKGDPALPYPAHRHQA